MLKTRAMKTQLRGKSGNGEKENKLEQGKGKESKQEREQWTRSKENGRGKDSKKNESVAVGTWQGIPYVNLRISVYTS